MLDVNSYIKPKTITAREFNTQFLAIILTLGYHWFITITSQRSEDRESTKKAHPTIISGTGTHIILGSKFNPAGGGVGDDL